MIQCSNKVDINCFLKLFMMNSYRHIIKWRYIISPQQLHVDRFTKELKFLVSYASKLTSRNIKTSVS